VPEFPNRERRSRLSQRVRSTGDRPPKALPPSPAWPPAAATVPEPVPARPAPVQAPALPVEAPVPREAHSKWLRARARAAWNDRLSRACLIGSGASLWFTVGLADPHFLLPLVVFSPALWWRERNRDVSPPKAEPEDWL
jgi:hypothetical protein